MALSLKDAKSHLSPKAYAQVQKQVDSGGRRKKPKALTPKALNPAEESLYILLKKAFEPTHPVCRETLVVPGRKYRADFCIPSLMLCIEVDGFEFHGKHKESFHHDRSRDFEIFLQGYKMIRIPATEILYRTADAQLKINRTKEFLQVS